MNQQIIERHFRKIGARAKVRTPPTISSELRIDVGRDEEGEFFDIALARPSRIDLSVIDVQPELRHLLMLSEDLAGKHKFLCGHDERHWFVAAVPERSSVSTVRTAFDALKPPAVRWRENQLQVKTRKRNRRRNEAFVRQGEWFFVPVPDGLRINTGLILHNEPISRGGGKPHRCEELVRQGGEVVYVSHQHPGGLTERERTHLISRQPKLRNLPWVLQRRNPLVFVRGKIRHADHQTILLRGWHQVLMNTESQSLAMRNVAFID